MKRYTIEELFQLKPSEPVQQVDFDAVEFKAIIEKVKKIQALREEEFLTSNRRRSSHHHPTRPKIKHNKPKVTTDEDGWSTFEPKSATTNDESAIEDDDTNVKSRAQETVRVKPNNKNIASSRPADARDIIVDKQVHGFNAFAALESDEEEEE
ncbi:hypothetical protein KAFR_0A04150 [Kazachstania africana CBS 2517]|uniref:Cap-associated protein CAF20 n=1 Tax=Kazachstania africana (strain ATCC 22294 / BCRC 22015 / CBS 2517 / CECT 1963 / NBRC 1671 / NRRL Y-8276) TaxID=1071382 RepID=H2ANA0_KAZAF|nr:hypothetical protein KAFR_0A04150 [Kazachstania africana CBS 2517]CCF55850.1 hypothetical protein KAFR_0A04150 [Kazachstania africana CBS 2517]